MVNSVRLLKVERPRGRLPWWRRLSERLGIGRRSREFFGRLRHVDPAHGFAWVWERRRRLARPVLTASLALWLLSGFYILPPDESGVIERFGRKILPHREPADAALRQVIDRRNAAFVEQIGHVVLSPER